MRAVQQALSIEIFNFASYSADRGGRRSIQHRQLEIIMQRMPLSSARKSILEDDENEDNRARTVFRGIEPDQINGKIFPNYTKTEKVSYLRKAMKLLMRNGISKLSDDELFMLKLYQDELIKTVSTTNIAKEYRKVK